MLPPVPVTGPVQVARLVQILRLVRGPPSSSVEESFTSILWEFFGWLQLSDVWLVDRFHTVDLLMLSSSGGLTSIPALQAL